MGGYIGAVPEVTNTSQRSRFTGDGATVSFSLVRTGTTNSVIVSVSGVVQDTTVYSVSGTTLTFTSAPPNGVSIDVAYLDSFFTEASLSTNTVLTGIPQAPTAIALNNSTQIATTQYVDSAVAAAVTADASADLVYLKSTDAATTYLTITNAGTTYAIKASPTFTGTLTVPNIAITGTTASTSTITGALTIAGGVGISGSVVAGSTITAAGDITAFSDARLKTNIQTITGALDKVSLLRGVSFTKDGQNRIGLVAQEVMQVIPEVVHEGEFYSVAYGNLVGLLVEAIKELKAEVEILKAGK